MEGDWAGAVPWCVTGSGKQVLPLRMDDDLEAAAASLALDELGADPRVDRCRIYAVGFSSAGYAAWRLAEAHSERLAAIVPLAGGAWKDPKCPARRIPVWAFHGARDSVTPLEMSTDMADAFRACGSPVRLTIDPEADHGGILAALESRELYRWLLAQRLERCPEAPAADRVGTRHSNLP